MGRYSDTPSTAQKDRGKSNIDAVGFSLWKDKREREKGRGRETLSSGFVW